MAGFHIPAESTFFKGLTAESLKALAAICTRRELRKREILFREGQPGTAVYLLRHGVVQLHKSAPDGRDVVIKLVSQGETFAEVVLFEQEQYPVTATALTPVDLLVFPRADMLRLLDHVAFRNDFIRMLMRKQRFLAERIVQLSAHDTEDRLLAFLSEQFGNAKTVALAVSKKDVAAAIGTTPETLSRVILKLTRRKVLTWRGRTVTRHGL
jgi:CRP-like cAMP-binding protein